MGINVTICHIWQKWKYFVLKQFVISSLFVCLLLGGDGAVFAQDDQAADIKIGETSLVPTVGVTYFNDDNVFADIDNTIESSGLKITPQLYWAADHGLNSVGISYASELVSFSDAGKADFSKHSVKATTKLEFSGRSRLNASLGLRKQQVQYSNYLSRNLGPLSEPIEYKVNDLNLTYRYGARTARGNLEFTFEAGSIDYTNYDAITAGFNYSYYRPSVTLLYAVSGDTRVLAGVSFANIDYDRSVDFEELDNQQLEIFTGFEWDATGKSGGDFRIGLGKRDNDRSARKDSSTMILDLGAYWLPTNYTRIELDGFRRFAVDSSSSAVRTELIASWKHDWSSRSYTNLRTTWLNYDSDTKLDQKTQTQLGLELGYKFYRWLGVRIEANAINATSPDDRLEYKKQWLGIGLDASL